MPIVLISMCNSGVRHETLRFRFRVRVERHFAVRRNATIADLDALDGGMLAGRHGHLRSHEVARH